MSSFTAIFRRPSRTVLLSSGAIALALAAGLLAWRPEKKVAAQTWALEATVKGLATKSLYFNGPARPWLLQWRPDLLTEEDRDEKSERARGMVQAVANKDLATCIVGSANPDNVRKWSDWVSQPLDSRLLAEVQAILSPIHNWFYIEGRPENNDPLNG